MARLVDKEFRLLVLSQPLLPYYRFKFTSSCRISSDVEMILVFAWNPRCATIIFVNSSARSTFDISKAPLMIDAAPSVSGATTPTYPAFGLFKNKLLPALDRKSVV